MAEPKPCNLIARQKIFHLAAGHVNSCCEAYPEKLDSNKSISDYISHWQDQKELLNQGVRVSQCKTCWQIEDQNKTSFRQQTLAHAVEDVYELLISNACNQMCSYCSPKFSSQWQESIESTGKFKHISATAQQNQQLLQPYTNVDYWIDKLREHLLTVEDQSVTLKLMGGEPLMQSKNLQELLEFDSAKIKTLQIHTNLAPPNNKFLNWVLENFDSSRLKFIVSLDSTPEYNYVPRGKFYLAEFNKNLNLIKASNITFRFLSVLSVLSIFDLENFIPWLTINQFNNDFQRLNNPECLNPELVPNEFRQKIYNNLNGVELPGVVIEVLTRKSTQSSIRLFEQYNYLTQYFERVNIEVSSIKNSLFQEYWAWLSSKYSKNLSTHS